MSQQLRARAVRAPNTACGKIDSLFTTVKSLPDFIIGFCSRKRSQEGLKFERK